MRKGLGFIPVGIVVALALMVTGASATNGGGRVATACSNVTVNGGRYVGKLTLRFGLIGRVSCNEAHSVVRAYYRKMAAGRCGAQNNFCNLQFIGGWDCSIFFAAETKETGGAIAGCARPGAKIRLYKAARPTGTHTTHLREFLSPDRKVWCVVEDRGCGTYPEPPTRSAEIDSRGNVTICSVPRLIYLPGAHVPQGCFQNWNSNAPILRYGQADLYGGIRCTSVHNGITCIKVSGAGQGKGFRINKDEAVEVG
jgi:hypothetical protein